MTFDVGQLPGRAAELKKLGIEYMVSGLESMDQTGAGYGYSEKLAEQSFAGVEHIYDDFLSMPSPEDFASYTTGLKQTMTDLTITATSSDKVSEALPANPKLAGISETATTLNEWTGAAAIAYKLNFAAQFAPVTSNQSLLAAITRHAINAEAAVWQAVRDDLDKLSNDAISKMKQCNDKNPSDWGAALSIAAAVLGGIAAPLTGGTSLEISFAAVGAGLSVASTAVPMIGQGTPDDDLGLSTGNPLKILESLEKALGLLKSHIVDAENLIVSNVNTSVGVVRANAALLSQPEPSLADASKHKYDDPTYLGTPRG